MGKRKARHPAEVIDFLSRKSQLEAITNNRWTVDYGWLVMLYRGDSDQKGWRHLPPGTTIVEARRVADDALRNDGYDKAWIIQKRD